MREKPAQLGQFCLLCGFLLWMAVFLDAIAPLPVGWPGVWYLSRPMCLLEGLLLLIVGGMLLSPATALEADESGEIRKTGWRPATEGRRFRSVVLYSREDCHLCDTALEVLEEHSAWLPDIEERDVDEQPEWREKYGLKIPVVEFDGEPRFFGEVSPVLLRRLIDGTPPTDRQYADEFRSG